MLEQHQINAKILYSSQLLSRSRITTFSAENSHGSTRSWFGWMNGLKIYIIPPLLYLFRLLPCTYQHSLSNGSLGAKSQRDLPDFSLYHASALASWICFAALPPTNASFWRVPILLIFLFPFYGWYPNLRADIDHGSFFTLHSNSMLWSSFWKIWPFLISGPALLRQFLVHLPFLMVLLKPLSLTYIYHTCPTFKKSNPGILNPAPRNTP